MCFGFGLEILRLVYKKVFFEILNGLTFYPLKKVALPLIRVEKKISSKLGVQGIKRSRILPLFQKCVELLRQEVPKDFSQKNNFLQNFPSP
jgi:hypothetical protein